jgi:hypothetical protein
VNIWANPGTIAAFLSAAAALFAAIATWRGPLTAAKLSERLRKASEVESERRRFRLNVFATIMQERAQIYSMDGVRALNSIDVAFSDASAVREAWAELYQALNTQPMPDHVVDERIRKLLREMSVELGISESLRLDDFGRIYYPKALVEEHQLQHLERAAALARLQKNTSPASNTSEPSEKLWPPAPAPRVTE